MSKNSQKQVLLRALRIDIFSLWQVIFLLVGTFFAWGIAEYSTSYFRERIESELKTVISSDIEVSSRNFPTKEQRETLQGIVQKYKAQMTESIEFPYVIEQGGTGARFSQIEVKIIKDSYPLYGKIEYTGSFSGAIANADIVKYLSGTSILIADTEVPITGTLLSLPGANANPFSQNKNLVVPETILPFEAIYETGSAYRYDYKAGLVIATEADKKALFKELSEVLKDSQFRVREQRSDGGNFTDIANTVNDFLGAILFASLLIVISSFLVAFLHFAQERKNIAKILFCMGVLESSIFNTFFFRILSITLPIVILFSATGYIFSRLSTAQFIQFGILSLLLCVAMIWIVLEIILSDSAFFQRRKKYIRITLSGVSLGLIIAYGYLAQGTLYPMLYAGIALVCMERIIWATFRYLPYFVESLGLKGKVRFSILDVLRSFTASPILGKISFSVFFLLSATLTGVFLFSLSFRESLVEISGSPIDAYVINLSPKDYDALVKWNAPTQFYSTIRARIEKINGKTLAEHIGEKDIPQQFSREFSITDTIDTNKESLVLGKYATKQNEVTVDSDFGKSLGLTVGDKITFSLAGRNFPFEVVGIRASKRGGLSPFFYFQIAKNAIEGAPKTYFLTADIGDTPLDEWKTRVLEDSGNHVTFIDVGPILDQVVRYSKMVLVGVMSLLFYIASIGLVAFLMSERTFFRLKIEKVQLYRLLGATKEDGYGILFFESLIGNIFPLLLGVVTGVGIFMVFAQSSAILRLSWTNTVISLIVIILFFFLSYSVTRKLISNKIEKTEPQIGNTNR